MTDGIIFDLDGTFWDTTEVVSRAWNEIREKRPDVTFRATPKRLKQLFGRPLPVIAEIIFPELSREKQLRLMDECCKNEHLFLHRTPGTLFPDVEATLKILSKAYPLFIVSNCEAGYIEVFLESTGFGKYFTDHECPGNTGKYKAENILLVKERNHLSSPVYVGDTQGDADASQKANVPFIYAAYGFGDVSTYTAKLSAFSELPSVLKELNAGEVYAKTQGGN